MQRNLEPMPKLTKAEADELAHLRLTAKRESLENAILDLIDNQDDFTRSDLQGVVSALALKFIQ